MVHRNYPPQEYKELVNRRSNSFVQASIFMDNEQFLLMGQIVDVVLTVYTGRETIVKR
jgi:hypothetical protein